jgi:hypothetical protein
MDFFNICFRIFNCILHAAFVLSLCLNPIDVNKSYTVFAFYFPYIYIYIYIYNFRDHLYFCGIEWGFQK